MCGGYYMLQKFPTMCVCVSWFYLFNPFLYIIWGGSCIPQMLWKESLLSPENGLSLFLCLLKCVCIYALVSVVCVGLASHAWSYFTDQYSLPALPDCSIPLNAPQFELSACFWWNVTTAIYPRAALENIWQRPLLKRDKCDTSGTILKSAHKQNFIRVYFWAKSWVIDCNIKFAWSRSRIIQDLSS